MVCLPFGGDVLSILYFYLSGSHQQGSGALQPMGSPNRKSEESKGEMSGYGSPWLISSL